MRGVAVLCLIVILGEVRGNWDVSNDSSAWNMDFVVRNLTCNDKKTVCETCFSTYVLGLVEIGVVKYTKDPSTLTYWAGDGTTEWNHMFTQEDPSRLFRYCYEAKTTVFLELQTEMRAAICIGNDFTAITVPAECAQPIATTTLYGKFADRKIFGQQTLFCIA